MEALHRGVTKNYTRFLPHFCILGSSQMQGWCKSSGCKICRIKVGWEILHLYFLRKRCEGSLFLRDDKDQPASSIGKASLLVSASLILLQRNLINILSLCFWFGFSVEMQMLFLLDFSTYLLHHWMHYFVCSLFSRTGCLGVEVDVKEYPWKSRWETASGI